MFRVGDLLALCSVHLPADTVDRMVKAPSPVGFGADLDREIGLSLAGAMLAIALAPEGLPQDTDVSALPLHSARVVRVACVGTGIEDLPLSEATKSPLIAPWVGSTFGEALACGLAFGWQGSPPTTMAAWHAEILNVNGVASAALALKFSDDVEASVFVFYGAPVESSVARLTRTVLRPFGRIGEGLRRLGDYMTDDAEVAHVRRVINSAERMNAAVIAAEAAVKH